MIELDFRTPQKNFKYPYDLNAFTGARLDESALRQVISPRASQNVGLFSDLTSATAAWLEQQKNLRQKTSITVGVQRPYSPEFVAAARLAGCEQIVILPRDPVELLGCDIAKLDVFVTSNPSRIDGFYYPQELFEFLIWELLKANPSLSIFSEESFNLFSLNKVAPGTLQPLTNDHRVTVAGTLYPAYAPQGPKLSWWSGGSPLNQPQFMSEHEIAVSYAALVALKNRQGKAAAELSRRLLATDRALRDFADAISPLLHSKRISVPLWPESGYFLCFDVSQELLRLGLTSAAEWCEQHATPQGILLNSGDQFGNPHLVQLCFAANPRELRHLGIELNTLFKIEDASAARDSVV